LEDKMKNKSYLTAIKRRKLSAPMVYLLNKAIDIAIIHPMLDYGCGYGADCDILGIDGYDPYFRPYGIRNKEYSIIFCTYVLNTLPSQKERDAVLKDIRSLLMHGGVAFISVRNDKKCLRGWTKKGTWQGLIKLPLTIIESNQNFIIYRMHKNGKHGQN
jgi:hypothetical protein